MMRLSDLLHHWNTFFFAPRSVLPVALYRICFGLLILLYGLMLWPDLTTWFGTHGVLSPSTAQQLLGTPRLTLLLSLPHSDAWLWGFFLIFLLAAFGLTIGLCTRLCAILVFLGLVSLHHRNFLILNSGDTFLRLAAFLLIWSRAGAALSVDRLWRILRGREGATPPRAAPWAQRLLQIQLALLYLTTLLWKLQGEAWWNGTALFYTSRLVEFWRFPVPYVFDHLWTIKLATWSTLVIEGALAFLVWIRELRYWVLLGGVLLHLGIEYSMNIPLFAFTMIAAYCNFVEGDDIQRVVAWLRTAIGRRGPQIPVFYDGHCVFCTRTVTCLATLDLGRRFQRIDFRRTTAELWPGFDPVRAEREMLVRTPAGAWHGGFFAVRYLARSLPLTWLLLPFLYLPGMRQLGPLVYAWVARHRFLLMGQCAGNTCALHV